MSVTRVPYNNERIGLLKQVIVNYAQGGKTKDYEIKVDDMKVVPRTNDPLQFDCHEEFIGENTTSVTIILYEGTSNNNTKHIFVLKEEPQNSEPKGLSGVEVDKMLSEKLAQERKQWQYEALEKQNQDLTTQLREAEDYIDTLEKGNESLQAKRKMEDVNWGNLAGVAAESILRRNAHLLAKIPGAEGLAGFIEMDNETKRLAPPEEPEGEVSFKKLNPDEEKQNQIIDEDDVRRLSFLQKLEGAFDEKGLDEVMEILGLLTKKPQALKPTKLFIQQFGETPCPEKKEKEIVAEPKEEIKKERGEKKENNTAYILEIINPEEDIAKVAA